MRLTAKQKRFCENVVEGMSYEKAAELAGYSAASAYSRGAVLMTQAHVLKEIDRLRAKPQLVQLVRAPDQVSVAARRQWLLDTFLELAEQRDNLSVALRAAEQLAQGFLLWDKLTAAAEIEDQTADSVEGMDLEKAKRIREAAA